MATTQLHPTGLSGKPWSFSPKVAAPVIRAQVTELSVMALPGGRHSFIAKAEAEVAETKYSPLFLVNIGTMMNRC